MIPTSFIAGSVRRLRLSVPLRRKPATTASYAMIVDLSSIVKKMKDDRHISIACMIGTPHDILESLIEEPLLPRDCPLIMEYLHEAMTQDALVGNLTSSDYFDELEIALEKLQIHTDIFLSNFHKSITGDVTVEYEVLKWLSGTEALISINPEGSMRYDR